MFREARERFCGVIFGRFPSLTPPAQKASSASCIRLGATGGEQIVPSMQLSEAIQRLVRLCSHITVRVALSRAPERREGGRRLAIAQGNHSRCTPVGIGIVAQDPVERIYGAAPYEEVAQRGARTRITNCW